MMRVLQAVQMATSYMEAIFKIRRNDTSRESGRQRLKGDYS